MQVQDGVVGPVGDGDVGGVEVLGLAELVGVDGVAGDLGKCMRIIIFFGATKNFFEIQRIGATVPRLPTCTDQYIMLLMRPKKMRKMESHYFQFLFETRFILAPYK